MSALFLWVILLIMGGVLFAMNSGEKSAVGIITKVIGGILIAVSLFGIVTMFL